MGRDAIERRLERTMRGQRENARRLAELVGMPPTPVHVPLRTAGRTDAPALPVAEGEDTGGGDGLRVLHASAMERRRAVVIGVDSNTGSPVLLSDAARSDGTYVIGLTGTGKSTVLGGIAVQDLAAGNGHCLIDAHGPLLESVLASVPSARADDVILLDATDEAEVFGLNIFDVANAPERLRHRYTSMVVEAFRKAFGQYWWGVQIQAIMRNTTAVLLAHPGMTIRDIPHFLDLDEKEYRQGLVAAVQSEEVKLWWKQFEKRSDRDKREYTDPIYDRLASLLDDPLLAKIVGAKRSTVNFTDAIQSGRIILVNLPVGVLGDAAVSFLGTVIVGQFLLAALAGAAVDLPAPFTLLCDEYQRFDTEDFATIFDEMRKGNIGLIVAHQRRTQLDTEKRRSAPLGARNRIVFQVTGADAAELAGEFDHTPPEPEIVGYKAGRELSTDPWAYLQNRPHSNPLVQQIVNQYRNMLQIYVSAYTTVFDDISNGREFQTMRLSEELAHCMRNGVDERRLAAERMNMRGTEERTYDSGMPHTLPSGWVTRQHNVLTEGVHKAADEMIVCLRDLGRALHKDPVYVATESQEPMYGPKRTYADMENEITTNLTSLPSYRAIVRILEDGNPVEYEMRTRPLAEYVTDPTADPELIRWQSRLRYGQEPGGEEMPLPVSPSETPAPSRNGVAAGEEATSRDSPNQPRTTRRRIIRPPPEDSP